MQIPLLDLSEQNALLRPEIEAALGRILDSNSFILGAEVDALEKELAEYCNTRFAIGCASGSDAILLVLMALGVGPGDEVITTPFSFFATASAIARLGARPVFADIQPDTFNIDPQCISELINDRTKAIEPVHLFGQCADMTEILEIAGEIPIVEDAAQAIGAELAGKRAGSIGLAGCFSFYPSKNLGGMGDGGFISTNDEELREKLLALRVHGSKKRYEHTWIGLNSRLDGFQAAVLRVKLPHLDKWSDARKSNADRYRDLFTEFGLNDLIVLPAERPDSRHIYNQYVIRVVERRDSLRLYLCQNGIGTDIYYPIPLHLQQCFSYLNYRRGDLPVAEKAADEVLALPVYPELRPEQQLKVVETIARFFGR